MKLIDTHAHYCDSWFTAPETPEQPYEEILDGLLGEGGEMEAIVNVATTPDNAVITVEQAKRWAGMYAAVGIHPCDCQLYVDPVAELARLRPMLDAAKENKIVALGEIGLDYHYDDTDREKQRAVFAAQLEMAEEYDLPVILHSRDATGECVDMVRAHPNVRGVFHAYGGSAETAEALISRGWYLGLGGVITFPSAKRIRRVAAALPLDRILLETDCPYTAPEPFRGLRNHSGFVSRTAEVLAELQNKEIEEIFAVTTANAKTFFEIL